MPYNSKKFTSNKKFVHNMSILILPLGFAIIIKIGQLQMRLENVYLLGRMG